jgi:hypothetical protein
MPEKKSKKKDEDKVKKEKNKKAESKASENKKGNALEMNLAEGEIVHYFNWKKAFFALVSSGFLAILILTAVYFGLFWWGEESAKQNEFFSEKSKELDEQIEETKKEAKDLFIFKKKLELVKNELLPRHIYWTNFFDYLEENTLSQVNYEQFSGTTDGSYSLPVITDDYNIINSQVELMRKDEVTQAAEVREASKSDSDNQGAGGANDSEVVFNLELQVSEELFTK